MKLTYAGIVSLDGYINDEQGQFDWSAPDEEVHAHVNERARKVGTYILGRRMYEVLKVWDTLDEPEPVMQDYAAIWRATNKIVVSTTLTELRAPKTLLMGQLDLTGLDGTVSIGGATLAAQAIDQVDEFELYLNPVIVGGGTRFFPDDFTRELRLDEQKTFTNGVVYLRYSAA